MARRGATADAVRRVERVKKALDALQRDLGYFESCRPGERQELRRRLAWADVGRVTSLVRALSEESRFAEWQRFNRLLGGQAFAGAVAREKSA